MRCNGCGREVESLGGVDFICWHCAGRGQISDETAEAICKVFLGISREELVTVLRDSKVTDDDCVEIEGEEVPESECEEEGPGRKTRARRLRSSLRAWLSCLERGEQVQ